MPRNRTSRGLSFFARLILLGHRRPRAAHAAGRAAALGPGVPFVTRQPQTTNVKGGTRSADQSSVPGHAHTKTNKLSHENKREHRKHKAQRKYLSKSLPSRYLTEVLLTRKPADDWKYSVTVTHSFRHQNTRLVFLGSTHNLNAVRTRVRHRLRGEGSGRAESRSGDTIVRRHDCRPPFTPKRGN
ncbi:hypothetical protein EVAR_52706_1 [Eumeta japonica]|uniref:Uncharacterized protein n=1 Tax=Eumeta variegata TaxID=151549 RepID=A0A4C1Y383_EUMVA|nr:hypothetical protein EVAR_52706_1 [Eumeta japonica]